MIEHIPFDLSQPGDRIQVLVDILEATESPSELIHACQKAFVKSGFDWTALIDHSKYLIWGSQVVTFWDVRPLLEESGSLDLDHDVEAAMAHLSFSSSVWPEVVSEDWKGFVRSFAENL
jgi:hypothetical protein